MITDTRVVGDVDPPAWGPVGLTATPYGTLPTGMVTVLVAGSITALAASDAGRSL
ncbi:hypothetical protein [Mycobacterium sp.]|uniref:hypothetical protein n=1 Tax=Mycobacterium sp. TaxID=1785 RepID=UPI003F9926DC